MEGYRGRSAYLAEDPPRGSAREAPSAEPRLAIIESGFPETSLVPEWHPRRSVLEKLALLQASKRPASRKDDDPLVLGGRGSQGF